MMKDAEKKAIPYIETYASVKALTECDSAQKIIGTDDGSMVSEYFPWLKKIGAYLKSHPEEAARIEKSVGTTGLIEFFN
jgi:argonaute-like protein implicated in RNA metabolism and viral defense